MLHLLSRIDPQDGASPSKVLEAQLSAAVLGGARGDRSLVGRMEDEVRAHPEAHLRFAEDGAATLEAVGRTFRAGRLETPSLGLGLPGDLPAALCRARVRGRPLRADLGRGPAQPARGGVLPIMPLNSGRSRRLAQTINEPPRIQLSC